jgi:hypothetical protein
MAPYRTLPTDDVQTPLSGVLLYLYLYSTFDRSQTSRCLLLAPAPLERTSYESRDRGNLLPGTGTTFIFLIDD